MRSRAWLAIICLTWTVAAPERAWASDRPVIFLHGFMSSPDGWGNAVSRLGQSVAMMPRLPPLDWRAEFETQARDLQASALVGTLPNSTVAVGHSNGGLVAREWSRLRGVGGLITIGTPHGGAPILQHLLQWSVFNDATRFGVDAVLRAFSVPSDWWWVPAAVQDFLQFVNGFSVMAVTDVISVLGVRGSVPVAFEMLPGSSYLNALNSPGNLAREATASPNRVGIVSVARNYYWAGPARAARPAQADTIAAVLYGAGSGLLAYGSLVLAGSGGTDVAAMNQGLSLVALATQIFSIDPVYCQLVSHPAMGVCIPNDGVVPVDRQAYPGAPNLWIEGPAHIQERDQSDDVLYHALVTYVGLPVKLGSPAPPPPPTSGEPPTGSDDGSDESGSQNGDGRLPSTIRTGELRPDEELLPDDTVDSTNGRLHLRYQRDGNLVLYDQDWRPLWATHTDGYSAGFVIMQRDGNLVVYDADGVPRWASNTSQWPGAWLAVQDDGNVVLYVEGAPVWDTGTFVN